MVAPIDYTLPGVQSPFQALAQGMQFGTQVATAEAQRRQAEAAATQQRIAAERQQSLAQAFNRLTERVRAGSATAADFQEFALQAPKDQAESALKFFNEQSAERKAAELGELAQLASALGSKNPQIGVRLIREKADAFRNKGDAETAKRYEVWAEIAQTDPADAQAALLVEAQRLPGGKDVVTAWEKAREEARKTALAPLDLAIKTAQAGKEGFQATQAGYEAATKFLELQYKPQSLEDAVKKRAADLKLTDAQTAQAVASAQQSRAMAGKIGAEAEAAKAAGAAAGAGIVPVDKRPEAEAKLRKEYNDNTKGFTEVRAAYDRVQASQDNAVGDLSLIFGYMKMLDPGSVVREGEFATAQNAAGVPDRVLNLYNRVLSGQRLNADQRASFKNQAGQLYNAAQKQEQVVRDGITRIGTAMGLNPQNIFYEAAVPAGPAATGVPIPTVMQPPPAPAFVPAMPQGFRLLPPGGR